MEMEGKRERKSARENTGEKEWLERETGLAVRSERG